MNLFPASNRGSTSKLLPPGRCPSISSAACLWHSSPEFSPATIEEAFSLTRRNTVLVIDELTSKVDSTVTAHQLVLAVGGPRCLPKRRLEVKQSEAIIRLISIVCGVITGRYRVAAVFPWRLSARFHFVYLDNHFKSLIIRYLLYNSIKIPHLHNHKSWIGWHCTDNVIQPICLTVLWPIQIFYASSTALLNQLSSINQ